MKLHRPVILVLFASLVLPTAAQAVPPIQARQPELTVPQIVAAVERKLRSIDGLDASRIQVDLKDGTARLTGEVATPVESQRVLDAASSVRGVRNVVASFTVTAEERPDEAIARDVRAALASDPATAKLAPQVTVDLGSVRLEGDAPTWPVRQLAEWIVADVRGVREVRNFLDVTTERRPDAQLKHAIERRFAMDTHVSDSIAVEVKDGVATLRGEVRSALEKRWAVSDARAVGVDAVKADGLRVTVDAPKAGAASRWTDAQLREVVAEAFLYDPRVNALNPQIEVDRGVVTLTGAVSDLKAKQTAVRLAAGLAGVRDVVDRLELRAWTRSDDEIARDLRAALVRSSAVDEQQVSIGVENGRVVLTGAVNSAFEKWTAGDLAARTLGVRRLQNRLTVPNGVASFGVAEAESPRDGVSSPWTYRYLTRTDAQLEQDVEAQLWLHPLVDEEAIEVEARQGVVTLKGEVDDAREKLAAERGAYLTGAREVRNQLEIAAASRGPR